MKILFISPAKGADYQCDMLLHGLKSLYGADVVDCPRVCCLYSCCQNIADFYGYGFTLYGLLPDHPCDRGNIRARISAHEFDLIIYGSCHRSLDHLDMASVTYSPREILFIDGEDQTHLLYNLLGRGLYFKRELVQPTEGVHPIHFAIPASKIGTLRHVPKSKVRAFIDPRDRSTYIYKDETAYYADYASSLFAFTCKKAGWDQLRTLEILANSCIPLYLGLDQCPEQTCINLPKPELLEALQYQDLDATYWNTAEGRAVWTSLHRRLHIKFAAFSTTEQLAQMVLRVAEQARTEAA